MSDNVGPRPPLCLNLPDDSPTDPTLENGVRLTPKILSRYNDPYTKNQRKSAPTQAGTNRSFSDDECKCNEGAPKTFPTQCDCWRHMWQSHLKYTSKTKMYICVACKEAGLSTIFPRKDNFKTHCVGNAKQKIRGKHVGRDWEDLASRSEVLACKHKTEVEFLKTLKTKRQDKSGSTGSVSRPSVTDSASTTFSDQPSSSTPSTAPSNASLHACLWPRCANGLAVFTVDDLVRHLKHEHGFTDASKIICPYFCEHRFMLAEIRIHPEGYFYHVKHHHSGYLIYGEPLDPSYEVDPYAELFRPMFQQ